MKKKRWVAASLIIIGAVAAWSGAIMSQVEQAPYTVVTQSDAIEIRDYPPLIVAETQVRGERKEAINDGFKVVADYIFGNNVPSEKVAMTAPVIQQSSTKKGESIAMTAPVIQAGKDNEWIVQFVMPSSYSLETLPAPTNDAVKLATIPAKRFAVIQFSGRATDESIQEQTTLLKQFVSDQHFTALGAPAYAFYNPPWTLPPLRRNEVMIEIAKPD